MAGGKVVGSSELDAPTRRAVQAALDKAVETASAATPALGGDLSGTTAAATIVADAVTNTKLANVPTATFKGRLTAGTGDPEDLTATQATSLLNAFTSALKGLVPASGGGTTNFLRADATWAAPPLPGAGTITKAMLSTSAGQMGAAWTAYTPTDTGITVGNGTRVAYYMTVGKTTYFRWALTVGTTTTFATSNYIGLPVAAVHDNVVPAYYLDSGTRHYVGCALISSGSALLVQPGTGNNGLVNSTNPYTWASGDRILVGGTYESA